MAWIAENQLQAARDRDMAAHLIADAENERQGLLTLIKAINAAIAADKYSNNLNQGKFSDAASIIWNAADQVIDVFTNSAQLIQKAHDLETEAAKITSSDVVQRFKDAGLHFTTLQSHLIDLKSKLAKAEYAAAVGKEQGDFDQKNATSKQSFQFSTINALISEARAVRSLSVETIQAASAAREYMKGVRSGQREWMADASGDTKVIQQIYDTADWVATRAGQTKQETEAILARLEDTYAKAMQFAAP